MRRTRVAGGRVGLLARASSWPVSSHASAPITSRRLLAEPEDASQQNPNHSGHLSMRPRQEMKEGKEAERNRDVDLDLLLSVAYAPEHATCGWTTGGTWSHRCGLVSEWTWRGAIGGRYALSLSGIERTQHLIVDLDAHYVDDEDVDKLARALRRRAPPARRYRSLDDFLGAHRRLDRAGARRTLIARELGDKVRALLEVIPEAIVVSSPRGLHVVAVLDADEDVHEVYEIGVELVGAVIGEAANVEVFPRPEARGARSGRLPLTGPAGRILKDDLTSRQHARRALDRAELLAAKRLPLAELRKRADRCRGANGRRAAATGAGCRPTVPRGEAIDGKLRGHAYADRLVELAACIGRGESFEAARRWSFALVVGFGLPVDEATVAFRALVERPGHEARHCATNRGQRKLLGTFQSCAKRHQRGVERGDLRAGGLKDPRVRSIARDLLRGHAPTPPTPKRTPKEKSAPSPEEWTTTMAKRRAAAKKAAEARWARARAIM
jgi:hypothetical protein